MATTQNLKDATSFAARADNLFFASGKTVANADLIRLSDALKGSYPYPGGGAWPEGRPDANDAAAWFYRQATALVKAYERRVSEAVVAQPSDLGT